MTAYGKGMTIAFAISAAAHLSGLGVWYAIEAGWAPRPTWLAQWLTPPHEKRGSLPQRDIKIQPPTPESVSRLFFIETDAEDENVEPLKKTPYYSTRSTRAANPQPDQAKEGALPKLEGKEKRVISTADATLPRPTPSSTEAKERATANNPPAATPPVRAPLPEPRDGLTSLTPKPPQPQSNLSLLEKDALSFRPVQVNEPSRNQQTESSGRNATASVARISPRKIPARLSEQKETNATRKGKVALDVKGSFFGAYDERLQAEVARRWYDLVEKYEYGERTGVVEIYFKLRSDGRIEDLAVQQNTAGEVLAQYCKKAIDDSAPFEPFPEELKALLAHEYREITFIFYY